MSVARESRASDDGLVFKYRKILQTVQFSIYTRKVNVSAADRVLTSVNSKQQVLQPRTCVKKSTFSVLILAE